MNSTKKNKKLNPPAFDEGEEMITREAIDSRLHTPPTSKVEPPINTNLQELPYRELSWENFELLCLRIINKEEDIEYCRQYGEKGENQEGIDIYARKESGEKHTVYQCKRYEKLTPSVIREAVKKFLAGKRAEESDIFVFCTNADMRDTKLTNEFENQVKILKKRGIKFYPWDQHGLNEKLKGYHEIVKDFFGTEWAKRFFVSEKVQYLTIPPARIINFMGRQKELRKLDQLLEKNERKVIVNGLGGIGKTELCRHYVLEFEKKYNSIAWVNYTKDIRLSFFQQFFDQPDFKKKQNVNERYEEVVTFLNKLDENSLLVIDNLDRADDPDLEMIFSLRCKVLVNSRRKIKGFKYVDLDFLPDDDCQDLFYDFYEGEHDDKNVDKIIQRSGKIPLVVELLARTAQNGAKSIKEFLEILQEKGFNLNEVIPEKVETSWRNSKHQMKFIEHLSKVFDISDLKDDELKVLINLSILPSDYIEIKKIFEWMDLETKDPINSLVKKGWLSQSPRSFQIRLHEVIASVIRNQRNIGIDECRNLVSSLTAKVNYETGENPIDKIHFLPFAESVLRNLTQDDRGIALLSKNTAKLCHDLQQYQDAFEHQKREIKITEKLSPKKKAIDLITSYNNMAQILKSMGKPKMALKYQKIALKKQEKKLIKYDSFLASLYNSISVIYEELGDLKQALKFQSKALQIREKGAEIKPADLSNSYNSISAIYRKLGQLERALEYQLKAVGKIEEDSKPNYPYKALFNNNLSMIYQELNRYEDALHYQLEALKIDKIIYKENHPNYVKLADSYREVSSIYYALEQLEKAEEYQLEAIRIVEKVFGEDHPELVGFYNDVSVIYKELGKFDTALEFQSKAVDMEEKKQNSDRSSLAIMYRNLSKIYKKMGKRDDALKYARQAVSIMKKIYPDGNSRLNDLLKNLESIEKLKGGEGYHEESS
ncbi:MAG: tetratricopeptide repeat protein [Candidatus Aminicenantes bacterium]|nr:tetratricopeptide repeat protein [Candidatus Aminicenantes bacterium]